MLLFKYSYGNLTDLLLFKYSYGNLTDLLLFGGGFSLDLNVAQLLDGQGNKRQKQTYAVCPGSAKVRPNN